MLGFDPRKETETAMSKWPSSKNWPIPGRDADIAADCWASLVKGWHKPKAADCKFAQDAAIYAGWRKLVADLKPRA